MELMQMYQERIKTMTAKGMLSRLRKSGVMEGVVTKRVSYFDDATIDLHRLNQPPNIIDQLVNDFSESLRRNMEQRLYEAFIQGIPERPYATETTWVRPRLQDITHHQDGGSVFVLGTIPPLSENDDIDS